MKQFTLAILIALLGFTSFAHAADDAEGDPAKKSKPIYVSMLPHFTVNLAGSNGQKFMRIKANTLVKDKETEAALKLHMPAIRHNVLMKLTHLKPKDVRSAKQKSQLMKDVTDVIRTTLAELGENSEVKGFYITSLVTQ